MDNNKFYKAFMALFLSKPCVQELTSTFSPFISGNKKASEQMTKENNIRVCSENSDKKQVENSDNKQVENSDNKPVENSDNKPVENSDKKQVENSDKNQSTDKEEARVQDVRGHEGERSKEKNRQCKSDDNEKETKSQEGADEIDNTGELMTCKFCQAQIPFNSYNSHIKEKHYNVLTKQVNSDNSDVDVAGRKRKQPESEAEVNPKKVSRHIDDTMSRALHASFTPRPASAILLYLCKTCTLATAVYDNAVEHAQNHILNLEIKTELCDICNLKFDADFNMHRELHANDDDIDRDSFKFVLFDYTVLMKPEWLNMFDTLPKETRDKIKCASIYFSTCCMRLHLQNDSIDASEKNTLFKCVTCNNYVDPRSVELHINNCTKKLTGHLCQTCNRPFITEKAKDQHNLVHEDPNAKENFRTVLFNDQRDLSLNKKLLEAGGKLVLVDEKQVENSDKKQVENSDKKPVENSDNKPVENSDKKQVENSDKKQVENSDKEQVENSDKNQSTDKEEARVQDVRGHEGERSKEKNRQCKSDDNEKETKSQEGADEIDNTGELMTCKFCQAQIPFNSYNSHIKEKHYNVFTKQVNSDNSDVDVAGRKRKQPESEAEVNPKKVSRNIDDTMSVTALGSNKNDAYLSAWRASFTPRPASAILMYLCKTCTLATAVYDKAVEHAQNHILNLEIKTELCDICNLKFDADFNMHRELHANDDDIDRDSFKFVLFDYTVLMKPEWLNMFDTLPKETRDKIKSASIYFSTCCMRLHLQNDSIDASEKNTLFKCVTCNNYVDPRSVELHINNCTKKLTGHLCQTCNRPFITEKAKDQHNLVHEDPNAKENFRTVLFNDQRDLSLNKKLLQAGGKLVLVDEESRKTNVEGRNEKQNDLDKASSKVANGIQSATTEAKRKVNNDRVENKNTEYSKMTNIYECQCGLHFHKLELLWRHIEICSPALKLVTTTCKCGLVFDEQNYDYHCEVHRSGFTTFNVKGVRVHDKGSLDVRGMIEEFKNTTVMTASNIMNEDMDGDEEHQEKQ